MARDNETIGDKSDAAKIDEIVRRARRTETRVTLIANHLGIDAGDQKPVFNEATSEVRIRSRKTSIEDIMAALPDGYAGRTDVYCSGDFLVTLQI